MSKVFPFEGGSSLNHTNDGGVGFLQKSAPVGQIVDFTDQAFQGLTEKAFDAHDLAADTTVDRARTMVAKAVNEIWTCDVGLTGVSQRRVSQFLQAQKYEVYSSTPQMHPEARAANSYLTHRMLNRLTRGVNITYIGDNLNFHLEAKRRIGKGNCHSIIIPKDNKDEMRKFRNESLAKQIKEDYENARGDFTAEDYKACCDYLTVNCDGATTTENFSKYEDIKDIYPGYTKTDIVIFNDFVLNYTPNEIVGVLKKLRVSQFYSIHHVAWELKYANIVVNPTLQFEWVSESNYFLDDIVMMKFPDDSNAYTHKKKIMLAWSQSVIPLKDEESVNVILQDPVYLNCGYGLFHCLYRGKPKLYPVTKFCTQPNVVYGLDIMELFKFRKIVLYPITAEKFFGVVRFVGAIDVDAKKIINFIRSSMSQFEINKVILDERWDMYNVEPFKVICFAIAYSTSNKQQIMKTINEMGELITKGRMELDGWLKVLLNRLIELINQILVMLGIRGPSLIKLFEDVVQMNKSRTELQRDYDLISPPIKEPELELEPVDYKKALDDVKIRGPGFGGKDPLFEQAQKEMYGSMLHNAPNNSRGHAGQKLSEITNFDFKTCAMVGVAPGSMPLLLSDQGKVVYCFYHIDARYPVDPSLFTRRNVKMIVMKDLNKEKNTIRLPWMNSPDVFISDISTGSDHTDEEYELFNSSVEFMERLNTPVSILKMHCILSEKLRDPNNSNLLDGNYWKKLLQSYEITPLRPKCSNPLSYEFYLKFEKRTNFMKVVLGKLTIDRKLVRLMQQIEAIIAQTYYEWSKFKLYYQYLGTKHTTEPKGELISWDQPTVATSDSDDGLENFTDAKGRPLKPTLDKIKSTTKEITEVTSKADDIWAQLSKPFPDVKEPIKEGKQEESKQAKTPNSIQASISNTPLGQRPKLSVDETLCKTNEILTKILLNPAPLLITDQKPTAPPLFEEDAPRMDNIEATAPPLDSSGTDSPVVNQSFVVPSIAERVTSELVNTQIESTYTPYSPSESEKEIPEEEDDEEPYNDYSSDDYEAYLETEVRDLQTNTGPVNLTTTKQFKPTEFTIKKGEKGEGFKTKSGHYVKVGKQLKGKIHVDDIEKGEATYWEPHRCPDWLAPQLEAKKLHFVAMKPDGFCVYRALANLTCGYQQAWQTAAFVDYMKSMNIHITRNPDKTSLKPFIYPMLTMKEQEDLCKKMDQYYVVFVNGKPDPKRMNLASKNKKHWGVILMWESPDKNIGHHADVGIFSEDTQIAENAWGSPHPYIRKPTEVSLPKEFVKINLVAESKVRDTYKKLVGWLATASKDQIEVSEKDLQAISPTVGTIEGQFVNGAPGAGKSECITTNMAKSKPRETLYISPVKATRDDVCLSLGKKLWPNQEPGVAMMAEIDKKFYLKTYLKVFSLAQSKKGSRNTIKTIYVDEYTLVPWQAIFLLANIFNKARFVFIGDIFQNKVNKKIFPEIDGIGSIHMKIPVSVILDDRNEKFVKRYTVSHRFGARLIPVLREIWKSSSAKPEIFSSHDREFLFLKNDETQIVGHTYFRCTDTDKNMEELPDFTYNTVNQCQGRTVSHVLLYFGSNTGTNFTRYPSTAYVAFTRAQNAITVIATKPSHQKEVDDFLPQKLAKAIWNKSKLTTRGGPMLAPFWGGVLNPNEKVFNKGDFSYDVAREIALSNLPYPDGPSEKKYDKIPKANHMTTAREFSPGLLQSFADDNPIHIDNSRWAMYHEPPAMYHVKIFKDRMASIDKELISLSYYSSGKRHMTADSKETLKTFVHRAVNHELFAKYQRLKLSNPKLFLRVVSHAALTYIETYVDEKKLAEQMNLVVYEQYIREAWNEFSNAAKFTEENAEMTVREMMFKLHGHLKQQIKPKGAEGPTKNKGGQNVIAGDKIFNLAFSVMFRLCKKVIAASLKPGFIFASGHTEEEAYAHYVKIKSMYKDCWELNADFEEYDSTQSIFTRIKEATIWRIVNPFDDKLEVYTWLLQNRWISVGWFSIFQATQRPSGSPDTEAGNTNTNMTTNAERYNLSVNTPANIRGFPTLPMTWKSEKVVDPFGNIFEFMVSPCILFGPNQILGGIFIGDDSLIFMAKNAKVSTYFFDLIFPIPMKIDIKTDVSEFCNHLYSLEGFCYNPHKLVQKIYNKNFIEVIRTQEKWQEYTDSLQIVISRYLRDPYETNKTCSRYFGRPQTYYEVLWRQLDAFSQLSYKEALKLPFLCVMLNSYGGTSFLDNRYEKEILNINMSAGKSILNEMAQTGKIQTPSYEDQIVTGNGSVMYRCILTIGAKRWISKSWSSKALAQYEVANAAVQDISLSEGVVSSKSVPQAQEVNPHSHFFGSNPQTTMLGDSGKKEIASGFGNNSFRISDVTTTKLLTPEEFKQRMTLRASPQPLMIEAKPVPKVEIDYLAIAERWLSKRVAVFNFVCVGDGIYIVAGMDWGKFYADYSLSTMDPEKVTQITDSSDVRMLEIKLTEPQWECMPQVRRSNACKAMYAGLFDILSSYGYVLTLDQMNKITNPISIADYKDFLTKLMGPMNQDWVKDLTQDGIEPNPGPVDLASRVYAAVTYDPLEASIIARSVRRSLRNINLEMPLDMRSVNSTLYDLFEEGKIARVEQGGVIYWKRPFPLDFKSFDMYTRDLTREGVEPNPGPGPRSKSAEPRLQRKRKVQFKPKNGKQEIKKAENEIKHAVKEVKAAAKKISKPPTAKRVTGEAAKQFKIKGFIANTMVAENLSRMFLTPEDVPAERLDTIANFRTALTKVKTTSQIVTETQDGSMLTEGGGQIFVFRDPLRHTVTYLPNAAATAWTYQEYFYIPNAVDDNLLPATTINLAYRSGIMGVELFPTVTKAICLTESTFAPHGAVMFPGTDKDNRLFGFWIGDNDTMKITANVPNGTATFTTYFWDNGGWRKQGTNSATTGITTVTMKPALANDAGYYAFTITWSGASSGTLSLYDALIQGSGPVYGHNIMKSTDYNIPSIDAIRLNAVGARLTNNTATQFRNGDVAMIQVGSGSNWYDYTPYNDKTNFFDDVANAEGGSGAQSVQNGAYAAIKPNSIDNFKFKDYFTFTTAGVSESSWDLASTDDFIVISINASNKQANQKFTLVTTCVVEFRTTDMWRETEYSRVRTTDTLAAFDIVRLAPQFSENPTHLRSFWSAVKNIGSKAARGVIEYAPYVVTAARTISALM